MPNKVTLSPDTRILSSILKRIGAHECLQKFIDDFRDDDSLLTLSKLKTDQISSRFGMSPDKAALFIAVCCSPDRSRDAAVNASSSTALPGPLPTLALTESSNLPLQMPLSCSLADCEDECLKSACPLSLESANQLHSGMVAKDLMFLDVEEGSLSAASASQPQEMFLSSGTAFTFDANIDRAACPILEEALLSAATVSPSQDTISSSAATYADDFPAKYLKLFHVEQDLLSTAGAPPAKAAAASSETTVAQCFPVSECISNYDYTCDTPLAAPFPSCEYSQEWLYKKQKIFSAIQVIGPLCYLIPICIV
jgi:hypothetical protein